MLLTEMETFDPDFASPAEWARMYRDQGVQVVPAPSPMRTAADKRPALAGWAQFQSDLVPNAVFDKWFPDNCGTNMGAITGAASGRLIVVDLDTYKNPEAAAWWRDATLGIEPETWAQRTGGGGRQIFLKLPEGVEIGNCRTAIGVDIRCQGGFAMMPPSRHLSGDCYRWEPHRGPWECNLDVASGDLVEAVQALIKEHGGTAPQPSTGMVQHTASPATDLDGFGRQVDGREAYMTRLVWGAVVDFWRDCPLPPSRDESQARMREAWAVYERKAKSRINESGTPNHVLLEREGRGHSMFAAKWDRAIRQWDGDVATAGKERPSEKPAGGPPEGIEGDSADEWAQASINPTFELLSVADIKSLPDPKWLVKGLVTDLGMGFIFGPPGCGKSFVALGMGLSVACGLKTWWGRDIERTGPVIYISSEGQSDLKFRIRAWEASTGQSADAAPFYLIRQPINFMVAEDIATLLRTIEIVADSIEAPCLVFVDTVSRVLPGADENLQKDMTLFVRACDLVREKFGATVVGVHHTSRAGNMRGSTVFDGAGDFLASIEREEGAETGFLCAKKIKAAEDGWRQAFGLEAVELGLGHTSLYAAPREAGAVENDKPSGWPDLETCRRILSAIDLEWAKKKPLSSYPQTRRQGRYAPAVLASQFDVSAKTAEAMMMEWLTQGLLSVEIYDSDSKMKGLKVTGQI